MNTCAATVLGLDVQPTRLGWALADLDTGAPLGCGCIPLSPATFSASVRTALRTIQIGADRHGEVALVAIEDAHLGVNRRGALRHAMAIGDVRQAVDRRWPEAAVQLIAPQEWKRLVGLPGNAAKGLVMDLACSLGWCPQEQQDAADAACISWAAQRRNAYDFREAGIG